MKARATLSGFACAAALTACATPYQNTGLLGGVSAYRLDETTVQIAARGNGFTDPDTIGRYVMRKAAEETVDDGYDLFIVLSSEDRTRTGSFYTPGSATTTASGSTDYVGNSAYGNATARTTYLPPQAHRFVKPGEAVTIKMLKGPKPPDAPPNMFDADEVLKYAAAR